MYEIKLVTADGHDEENVVRHTTQSEALDDAAHAGRTSDVFSPNGARIARVHPDGGIDRV